MYETDQVKHEHTSSTWLVVLVASRPTHSVDWPVSAVLVAKTPQNNVTLATPVLALPQNTCAHDRYSEVFYLYISFTVGLTSVNPTRLATWWGGRGEPPLTSVQITVLLTLRVRVSLNSPGTLKYRTLPGVPSFFALFFALLHSYILLRARCSGDFHVADKCKHRGTMMFAAGAVTYCSFCSFCFFLPRDLFALFVTATPG